MKKTLFLAAVLGLSAAFCDHDFSGTRSKRHQKLQHMHRREEQKRGWFSSSSKEKTDSPFFKRDYMTGTWCGARAKLAEKGWTFSSTYASDVQWSVAGGNKRGFGECSSFGLDMNIDFGRLAHVQGFSLTAGFVYRSGVNLTSRRIGNQFNVGQIYGSETYLLDVLYLQQVAFDGRFLLRAGRLNGGDNFLQSNSYYRFVNNAFCGNPVSIFSNAPFSAYPNATWGAYLQVKPSSATKWKFGVYNGNTKRKQNKYHGAYMSFHSDVGAIALTELDWSFGQDPGDWWYPSSYKVGTYGVSKKVAKYTGGSAYNYGTYVQFDQTLYLPSKTQRERGLKAFGAVVLAPKDRAKFPLFFTTGLIYQGFSKNRPNDALCLGLARGSYSSVFRQTQGGNQHYEAILEANYWVYLSPWWYIAPDYQYVMHPNGGTALKNAHVVGVQSGVTF